MRKLLLLFVLTSTTVFAQIATTGLPAPTLSGTGTPAANSLTCSSTYANLQYIQLDASPGQRSWLCDNYSAGGYAWDHLVGPISVATTASITGGSFIVGGCTAVTTVTVAGAVVGTNAAVAAPIYATAPAGSQGLFNVTAWVSAANTVSVQGCAIGILGSVPNFTAKVLLY